MTHATVREAERTLAKIDPVMRSVIARHGPCPLGGGRPDYFDTLSWSIVSQQLSTKAASTIGKRVLELTGQTKMSATHISSATHKQLRAAGLSNNKARFLQALAEEALDGRLNFRSLAQLSDEAVIDRLVKLKGIGRWTAEMFLMFALKRSDVASPDDVGLQRAMYELYGLRKRPSPRRFHEIARPWSPYRTVACWYLWRTVD
ncbi:MAG: DNA-3-methyladenine glycosylase [Gammaproteobacteria bacterium]